jgi:hypothetical protein
MYKMGGNYEVWFKSLEKQEHEGKNIQTGLECNNDNIWKGELYLFFITFEKRNLNFKKCQFMVSIF